MGPEVLDQRLGLFGGVLLHLTDLLLQVHAAGTALLPQQALLDVVADEESFDLILVELAASGECVLVEEGRFYLLCDFAGVEGDGFLSGFWLTTYS